MTTRREAELETENRMLRAQVASLEKIIEQATRPPLQWHSVPGAAGYPWWVTYYTPVTWSSGNLNVNDAGAALGGGGTVTMNTPSPVITS